jgi:hypothetical protein
LFDVHIGFYYPFIDIAFAIAITRRRRGEPR